MEGFGNSGVADGHIVERGFRDREFDIQVTYVHDYEEALRRELMVKQGYAPGAGPIHRDKKSGAVVATMEAVDMDFHVRRAAAAITKRFETKAAISYPTGTVLVIAFEEVKLLGLRAWQDLLRLVDQGTTLNASRFQDVYVLNCATNELQKAA